MHYETDYNVLLAQAKALTDDEPDSLANLANVSSLLFSTLGTVNWCGFYLRREHELVLGPFQGNSACTRIAWGKGVCGSAAADDKIMRVDDVHQFDGHIACDAASESEIVLPLHRSGKVIGVLDIDSPVKNRFVEADQNGLSLIAALCEQLLNENPASLGLD